ncbi:Uncharacterized protein OBRU01_00967, partial [Operophtera brumata]
MYRHYLLSAEGRYHSHPYIVFFHWVFRSAAIVVYVLCGWFSESFIASFVLVVLLLSADFWTVKNISGRLLVGLRWWNYVDDDGKSHWNRVNQNESRLFWMGLILCPLVWSLFFIVCLFGLRFKWMNRVNQNESRLFWMGLILCPLVWSLFFIVCLFGLRFKWMLVVLIALTLSGANLLGYIKCKFGAKQDLTSATTDFMKKQLLQNATSF